MKSEEATSYESFVARSLAPEDLRRGDYVTVISEIVEWPSFYWHCDSQVWPPQEPIRLRRYSEEGGTPLKIKAICLPFVFVKKPCGGHLTLDIRQHRLVRLPLPYARTVWKALTKPSAICNSV